MNPLKPPQATAAAQAQSGLETAAARIASRPMLPTNASPTAAKMLATPRPPLQQQLARVPGRRGLGLGLR